MQQDRIFSLCTVWKEDNQKEKGNPLLNDLVIPTTLSLLELQRVTRQVETIIASRAKKQLRGALRILAEELAGQLDQVAHLKRKGYPADLSTLVFQEMCAELHELSEDDHALFMHYFFEACEQQPPYTGKFEVKIPYVGVSERTRQRLSAKAQQTLLSAQEFIQKVGT